LDMYWYIYVSLFTRLTMKTVPGSKVTVKLIQCVTLVTAGFCLLAAFPRGPYAGIPAAVMRGDAHYKIRILMGVSDRHRALSFNVPCGT
jgi:hypothetical protein